MKQRTINEMLYDKNFFNAIKRQDVKDARIWLSIGADLHGRKNTAIENVLHNDDTAMLELFMEYGITLEDIRTTGLKPVCEGNSVNIMNVLLDKGYVLETKDLETVLHAKDTTLYFMLLSRWNNDKENISDLEKEKRIHFFMASLPHAKALEHLIEQKDFWQSLKPEEKNTLFAKSLSSMNLESITFMVEKGYWNINEAEQLICKKVARDIQYYPFVKNLGFRFNGDIEDWKIALSAVSLIKDQFTEYGLIEKKTNEKSTHYDFIHDLFTATCARGDCPEIAEKVIIYDIEYTGQGISVFLAPYFAPEKRDPVLAGVLYKSKKFTETREILKQGYFTESLLEYILEKVLNDQPENRLKEEFNEWFLDFYEKQQIAFALQKSEKPQKAGKKLKM